MFTIYDNYRRDLKEFETKLQRCEIEGDDRLKVILCETLLISVNFRIRELQRDFESYQGYQEEHIITFLLESFEKLKAAIEEKRNQLLGIEEVKNG